MAQYVAVQVEVLVCQMVGFQEDIQLLHSVEEGLPLSWAGLRSPELS